MNTAGANWADFSIGRLGELCRLQQYCDCYADSMTKRFLQHAIFSVYLDCREAGISEGAREVLAEWVPAALDMASADARASGRAVRERP